MLQTGISFHPFWKICNGGIIQCSFHYLKNGTKINQLEIKKNINCLSLKWFFHVSALNGHIILRLTHNFTWKLIHVLYFLAWQKHSVKESWKQNFKIPDAPCTCCQREPWTEEDGRLRIVEHRTHLLLPR